jgi:hypothetical protein
MRVGVYVDGFNLYFGARDQCGQGTAGWRWLDIRGLVADKLPAAWSGPRIERVVYCTARVSGIDDPSTPRDQTVYLRALHASGSVDHVEFGNFVRRVKTMPLATWTAKGKPEVVRSRWPVMVQDDAGGEVSDARFVVSVLHREEKGSDVNVATHLLLDVFGRRGGCCRGGLQRQRSRAAAAPGARAGAGGPNQPGRQAPRRQAVGSRIGWRGGPLVTQTDGCRLRGSSAP